MPLFLVPRSLPNYGGEQQSSSQRVEHGEGYEGISSESCNSAWSIDASEHDFTVATGGKVYAGGVGMAENYELGTAHMYDTRRQCRCVYT